MTLGNMPELDVLKAQPYAGVFALSHIKFIRGRPAEVCGVFLLAPLLVGSHLLAVADSVPVFDVKKSCQGRDVAAVFAGRNSDTVCIQSEEEARDQLRKIWGEFSAKDKAGCTLTATTGGIPSYIELLTCLEIIRDVDKIHFPDKPEGDVSVGSRRKRR